jgi:hypothetical protein
MDDHRTVSVSRVYVPNEYTVYLSSADREQFEGYENSLLAELEEYLTEHAKRENYALLTPARVLLETDEDLAVGEFGIATRMVQPRRGTPDHDGAPAEQVEPGATMIYKPTAPPQQAAPADEPAELGVEVAVLSWDGQRRQIDKRRIVLGRSRDCDIQLEDPNASRRHAELRQEGASFWVVDLDSTNGLEVNGKRAKRAKLDDGDTFTIGSTEITFSKELQE